MENVYCIFEDERLLCVCRNEADAQEMILSLTEEYAWLGFLRNINNIIKFDDKSIENVIWMFQHAPKYGWNKYYYEKRRMFYE